MSDPSWDGRLSRIARAREDHPDAAFSVLDDPPILERPDASVDAALLFAVLLSSTTKKARVIHSDRPQCPEQVQQAVVADLARRMVRLALS